jgi:exosortase/archaeosortase family protein
MPLEERYVPALSAIWEQINDHYRTVLLLASEKLLNILGYETILINNYVLKIIGYKGIAVGNYCLGFQLIYYFSMLVIISEISIAHKAIGILIGFVITSILNIIRITLLNLMTVYAPEWMFLSHDYIFNFIVFGILMLYYYKLIS